MTERRFETRLNRRLQSGAPTKPLIPHKLRCTLDKVIHHRAADGEAGKECQVSYKHSLPAIFARHRINKDLILQHWDALPIACSTGFSQEVVYSYSK
jgi:hypothetical protein